MRGLCNKVVRPIDGLTQVGLYCRRYYLKIHSYIYVNCDMPKAKRKIEFYKVLQRLCTAKSKRKSDSFTYIFNSNYCFSSSFKSHFQEA